MERWIISSFIFLISTQIGICQQSLIITVMGDTLVGKIRNDADVLNIKMKKESRTLFPEEVKEYYDAKRDRYYYSKPVRSTENSMVYGYVILEIKGAVNLYSREHKSFGQAERKMVLSEKDKELLERYGENTESSSVTFGYTDAQGFYHPGNKGQSIDVEYYLEGDGIKFQLADSNEIVHSYIVGDFISEEKLFNSNFSIKKKLYDLIRDYNTRHKQIIKK